MGRRCRRHEGRRQAPVAHSAGPGLRKRWLFDRDPAQRNAGFRRAIGRCEVARVARTLLSAKSRRTNKGPRDSKESAVFVENYALTTLPLRRQEVQTRMCLVAAPTLA